MINSEFIDRRSGEIVTQVPLSDIEHFIEREDYGRFFTPSESEVWRTSGVPRSELRVDNRGRQLNIGDYVRNIECPGAWLITSFEMSGNRVDGYMLMAKCEDAYSDSNEQWFACSDVIYVVDLEATINDAFICAGCGDQHTMTHLAPQMGDAPDMLCLDCDDS